MLQFIRRYATRLALTSALLVSASVPALAQSTPLANGHGAVQAPSGPINFSFAVLEHQSGSVTGHLEIYYPDLQGWVHVNVTSVMTIGDMVLMAGPVTGAFNAPPEYALGNTAILAVKDHGNGNGSPTPDESTGGVGPPNWTIQQVVAAFGPPPPAAFNPLESGNIKVH